MAENMNIVFMGTPEFAVPSLEALVSHGYNVVLVVTQKDKPKDRGKEVKASPVKAFAEAQGIPVLQPTRLNREPDMVATIAAVNPNVIVTCAFGQILPKSLLDVPSQGTINVHASLLPELRGAAPIQWAMLRGFAESGITTMFTDEGLDTGDMLLKESVLIPEDMTAGELHDMLSLLGAAVLLKTLKKMEKHQLEPVPQDNTKATLAPRFMKDIGIIDWHLSAWEIHNLVRGMDPWPGATTTYNGQRVKICRSITPGRPQNMLVVEVIPDLSQAGDSVMKAELDWALEHVDTNGSSTEVVNLHSPGTILSVGNEGMCVQTGNGELLVSEIQMPNGKRMSVKHYLNGHSLAVGTVLK